MVETGQVVKGHAACVADLVVGLDALAGSSAVEYRVS
jgi:hypothetical protein